MLKAPKPNTRFYRLNGRLALYHTAERAQEYWRTYWDDGKRAALVERARRGDLGEFESVVQRYVPRNLPVLEAGCGPGHLAAALQRRGYQVSGIDYETDVVAFASEAFPDVDIREGNVLNLEREDGTVGCYFSVGVVEHFKDGPDDALREARRVIHDDGVALISVPYLNKARRKHSRKVQKVVYDDMLHFHQYYFGTEEFRDDLSRAGFTVIDLHPYAVEAFLIREHPLFSTFWNSAFCRERIKRPLRATFKDAPSWMRFRHAHMMMYVCVPASSRHFEMNVQ